MTLSATISIAPVGRFGLVASGPRATTSPSIVTTDSARRCSSTRERLAVGAADDLGQAIMIAQVDEQHPAMVALAVHPAGQADAGTDIALAELAAIVGTVGVDGHDEKARIVNG